MRRERVLVQLAQLDVQVDALREDEALATPPSPEMQASSQAALQRLLLTLEHQLEMLANVEQHCNSQLKQSTTLLAVLEVQLAMMGVSEKKAALLTEKLEKVKAECAPGAGETQQILSSFEQSNQEYKSAIGDLATRVSATLSNVGPQAKSLADRMKALAALLAPAGSGSTSDASGPPGGDDEYSEAETEEIDTRRGETGEAEVASSSDFNSMRLSQDQLATLLSGADPEAGVSATIEQIERLLPMVEQLRVAAPPQLASMCAKLTGVVADARAVAEHALQLVRSGQAEHNEKIKQYEAELETFSDKIVMFMRKFEATQ